MLNTKEANKFLELNNILLFLISCVSKNVLYYFNRKHVIKKKQPRLISPFLRLLSFQVNKVHVVCT